MFKKLPNWCPMWLSHFAFLLAMPSIVISKGYCQKIFLVVLFIFELRITSVSLAPLNQRRRCRLTHETCSTFGTKLRKPELQKSHSFIMTFAPERYYIVVDLKQICPLPRKEQYTCLPSCLKCNYVYKDSSQWKLACKMSRNTSYAWGSVSQHWEDFWIVTFTFLIFIRLFMKYIASWVMFVILQVCGIVTSSLLKFCFVFA